jgi:fumarate hydratase class II
MLRFKPPAFAPPVFAAMQPAILCKVAVRQQEAARISALVHRSLMLVTALASSIGSCKAAKITTLAPKTVLPYVMK